MSDNRAKGVFLDRDGTLIHDRPGHYLARPQDLRLYKHTPQALRILAQAGFKLFVVSNQSGIGRGYYTDETARAINKRMTGLLEQEGVIITDIAYCPHAPAEHCVCRKPLPYMGLRFIEKYGLNPKLCYMVGDKLSDLEFGRALGVTAIFVRTGNGRQQLQKHGNELTTEIIARDILSAAEWITKHEIQN
ncbi:MAG: HAD family hydrolase [Elusimicrobiaceae bacterium]|nr:HAD family hydrolase [Elusimicrobiaceae bacterium]